MRFPLVVAVVVGSVTTTLSAPTYANQIKGLNDYAKEAGKLYFGTATDNTAGSWQDPTYTPILDNSHDFGQLTPANAMKWYATEPSRGVFNYTGGDELVSRAVQNGQLVRCHTLIWHSQLADWVTSTTWDNATLISIMESHITNLVTHFGSSCYAWDVVNEALNEDGTYRESIFYNTIGSAYIPLAFQFASAALANISSSSTSKPKLYYNDYNIESPSPKSSAAATLITTLKSHNIPIDGIGLQSHFIVGSTPSRAAQTETMQSYISLGVEVAITELDVRFESLPPTQEGLEQQATDYTETVGACSDVGDECVGVTLWDFSDRYSWIPGVFEGEGDASPWDADNMVKPQVYQAIVDGLTE